LHNESGAYNNGSHHCQRKHHHISDSLTKDDDLDLLDGEKVSLNNNRLFCKAVLKELLMLQQLHLALPLLATVLLKKLLMLQQLHLGLTVLATALLLLITVLKRGSLFFINGRRLRRKRSCSTVLLQQ
jgi:hypothetical protein